MLTNALVDGSFYSLINIATLLLAVLAGFGLRKYFADLKYNLPPGPLPLPFIGNIALLGSRKRKPWEVMRDLSARFGPLFTFYMGQFRMIVLCDTRVIHDVLVTQSKIFSWRQDRMMPGFEQVPAGVIYANHDSWRYKRRLGLRAMRDFGMGKDDMVVKVQDEVAHLLAELDCLVGKPFNPKSILTTSISNVICSLVFGKRFNYGDRQLADLIDSLDTLASRSMIYSIIFFIFPFLKYFTESVQIQDFRKFQDQICKLVAQAVEEHRLDFDEDNIRDFPDLFIQAERKSTMNDDGAEVEGEMDLRGFGIFMTDMFAAGTETTSTALNWTLLYLASHPEVQKKCQADIDRVITCDRLPTMADRGKLIYIDALMKEVLRHASIVPMALMHSNLDVEATVAGYQVPPYTLIMYNVTALHYDPNYWQEPEKFNPDRWISPEGDLLTHSSHYMPFGLGPRLCLGEQLARVEYFIFIVAILQRYEFLLKNPVNINQSMIGIVNAPPFYEIITKPR